MTAERQRGAGKRKRVTIDRIGTRHRMRQKVAADPTLAALIGIAGLALALRLAMVWYARNVPATPGPAFDSPVYLQLGMDWSRGRPLAGIAPGPPNLVGTQWYFAPGYPVFLGAIQAMRHLLGDHGNLRVWIGVAQAALGAWAVLLVGLLARRMPFHPRPARVLGILSAAVLALWPGQILGTAVVLSEGLFTPALLTGVALLVWRPTPPKWALVASGAIFGALLFTRYGALPLIVPATYVAVLGPTAKLRSLSFDADLLRRGGAFLGGCLVIAAPWAVMHNSTTGNGFYPDSSAIVNLCQGNREGGNGEFDPMAEPCDTRRYSDAEIQQRTRRWIVSNIDEQPGLIRTRFRETMESDSYAASEYPNAGVPSELFQGSDERYARAADSWWSVARWVSAVGLAIGIIRWRAAFRRSALIILSTLLGALSTTGTARYHDPIVPLLAICVATVPVVLWEWLSSGGFGLPARRTANPRRERSKAST